ncbi:MAG TPA: hypothetical protein V6C95_23535 [Coleofasciculaceae cyanobacterium]
MPNHGDAKLQNHIQGAAPGTLAAMGQLFGIGQEEFLAAVYGDPGAIKKIADLGRLSQVAKDNLEKALEATRSTIETTGDVNAALADLAKLTHKSGTQIMRSVYDASLAEHKMANELLEMKDRQGYSIAAETARHLRTNQLIQIQGTTAELMAVAKYQSDLIKEQNKPQDAQDAADRAYDKAVNALLWQHGSDAKTDRIPKPNYTGARYPKGNPNTTARPNQGVGSIISQASRFWKGFRNAMGI